MKRVNEEDDEIEDKNYYEIESYPSGGGYGGVSYIHLKDSTPINMKSNTQLDQRVTIEILWPNGETSEHKIITTEDHDSFYDRDACTTFHDVTVWSHVDIQCNGAQVKKVKLNEITGIKARVIGKSDY